ncbi:VOC family protein [Sporosarcina sp. A2]|uniref:VOC family protein n=1 Tax=Sporosarcina sp. A2 TaxID=3393449 RepID=UPI003D7B0D5A
MKLDHVVWFTRRTPEQIATEYEGAFVGGRHEQWGTYNALKYVQNGYIEWLAIEDSSIAEMSQHPLVKQLRNDLTMFGEGWGTLCVSTENIEALNLRLQQAGMSTSGVLDASRETSSGKLKKWKMLFVDEQNNTDLPAPFFIEWEEDEETRRNALREEGAFTESSDSDRIHECVLISKDPIQEIARWSVMLAVEPIDETSLMLEGIRLRFKPDSKKRNRMHTVVTGQAY